MSQYHPDTSAFLDQQGRFAQQRGDTVTAQAFVNARLEYDRLNAQALELCAELSGLRRENERLRGLLGEAADDIEHWGGYASEYFKDKWHLEDDIKKYRDAALAGTADQLHWSSGDPSVTITPQGEMSVDPQCPACGRSTKRHPGYIIGNHWLESAYERICAGEAEDDVLRDYDVVRVTNQPSVAVDNGWRETVMACGCIYRGVLTPFCPYHPATPVPTTEVQK